MLKYCTLTSGFDEDTVSESDVGSMPNIRALKVASSRMLCKAILTSGKRCQTPAIEGCVNCALHRTPTPPMVSERVSRDSPKSRTRSARKAEFMASESRDDFIGKELEESTMSDDSKKKDTWDKIASITPLVLGLAVTGVGVFFTQTNNFRQLQLNQITALDKFRTLLNSKKAEDREFGYEAFVALGYEEIAIRIIALKNDESGRSVLVGLKTASSPQIQDKARQALASLNLNEAERLVKQLKIIISDQLGVEKRNVTLEASFVDDLGADSLDTVGLVMAIEEELEIEIPDDEAEQLVTVGDVVKHVQKLRSQTQRGSPKTP